MNERLMIATWALHHASSLIAEEAKAQKSEQTISFTGSHRHSVLGGGILRHDHLERQCEQTDPDHLTDLGWCQQMLAESMTALDACVAALESTAIAKPDSGPAQVQWSDALKLAHKAIDRFSENEMVEPLAKPKDKPLAGMVLADEWDDGCLCDLADPNLVVCRTFGGGDWAVYGWGHTGWDKKLVDGVANDEEESTARILAIAAARSLGATGGPVEEASKAAGVVHGYSRSEIEAMCIVLRGAHNTGWALEDWLAVAVEHSNATPEQVAIVSEICSSTEAEIYRRLGATGGPSD